MKPIEYSNRITTHLILYAKGHYLRSSDIMCDLRTMMSNYSGTPPNVYTDETIYSIVSDSFVDSCSESDIKEILKCFYRKPFFMNEVGASTIEEMVSHMIGMMGGIQVLEIEGDKKIELVKLGEPNPKYLPLPNKDEPSLKGERSL